MAGVTDAKGETPSGGRPRMNWKLGAVWGVILSIIQWLEYLAAQGGFSGAAQLGAIITLGTFAYIGYSTYRLVRKFTQVALTTMLVGFIVGILGTLPLFFERGAAESLLGIALAAFATAIYGLVLGSLGSFWARMQLARGGP